MRGRRGRQRADRDVFGVEDVALVTPDEAASLDAAARERQGIPERVLMESAGRSAALILHAAFPEGRVLVVAGSGNNGGDAAVLARLLLAWGRDVALVAVGSRSPDPALLHGFPVSILSADDIETAATAADIVVDGILGTGTQGAPRGGAARAIEALNASGRPILSLDLPSGVDAGAGTIPGAAVRAAITVTFGWPKIGLMFQPARQCCGRLVATEIGFPPLPLEDTRAALITPDWASRRLPRRAPDAHKGTAGRLLVLAGTDGMAGAALLAARSAQRAGAGLVRIVSAASNRVVIHEVVPEATYVDRDELSPEDAQPMHALLAGPGMGTGDASARALERAIELTPDRPTLFDADALNLFAKQPDRLIDVARSRPVVITPHPMEMSRLASRPIDAIVSDPVASARAAAARFGCVVLLKGQPSIVADPDGRILLNTSGSSDVATAGMGDQLAGAIGAMLAAGLEPAAAAGVGLYFSGRAADLASLGRSLSPADVCEQLPAAFRNPGARPTRSRPAFITFDQPPRW